MIVTLTDAQFQKLLWLHERGGSGYIDRFGRICACGEHLPAGAFPALINLVANGMLSGAEGRIFVTPLGRGCITDRKG